MLTMPFHIKHFIQSVTLSLFLYSNHALHAEAHVICYQLIIVFVKSVSFSASITGL